MVGVRGVFGSCRRESGAYARRPPNEVSCLLTPPPPYASHRCSELSHTKGCILSRPAAAAEDSAFTAGNVKCHPSPFPPPLLSLVLVQTAYIFPACDGGYPVALLRGRGVS